MILKRYFDKMFINRKGFSLGETLIVLAVISIISSIVVVSFRGMNDRQVLDKGVKSMMSILNETRSLSLSSKDGSDHGVYLEEGKITTFIGSSYNQMNEKNKVYTIDPILKVSSEVPQTLIFKRTSGKLSVSQTFIINLALKNNLTSSSSITVFPTGMIQKNEN